MIGRECFVYAALLHDNKAGAIDQAPVFVCSLLQKLPRVLIQGCIDMHKFDLRRGSYSLDNRDNPCARKSQRAMQQGDKFGDDVVCRDRFLSLLTEAVIAASCRVMVRLASVYQACPSRRVNEDLKTRHDRFRPLRVTAPSIPGPSIHHVGQPNRAHCC